MFELPYQVITHRDETGSEVISVHCSILLLQPQAKFQVQHREHEEECRVKTVQHK